MSRKMYIHQVDRYEVRCPFENPDSAAELFDAFRITAQVVIHRLDKGLGKTELQMGLPEIRGVGVEYAGELFTAFGEGFSVTFLDAETLKNVADRLQDPGADS